MGGWMVKWNSHLDGVMMLVVVMLVVVTFKAVPDPLTLTVVACGGYEREGDVRRW